MLDKNGVEMRTGDIVRITDAFFKNDNGLYFVENSPGDPNWSGRDHCLKKILKSGKISKAKHNICFWPIGIFISDHSKAQDAHNWNKQHAQVEVMSIKNMKEVSDYFLHKAEDTAKYLQRVIYDWGEEHPEVQKLKAIREHYLAVVQYTSREKD